MSAFDTELRAYAGELEARGATARTVLNYLSCAQVFLHWLDGPIEAVDEACLARFKRYLQNDRRVGPKSILRYYSALQALFDQLEYATRIPKNPIPAFRRRYLRTLRREALKSRSGLRQVLTVEQAAALVRSVYDARDRAILLLLFKTGIRREELVQIDLNDIDWQRRALELKPRPKRTNTLVFFDRETETVLRAWLRAREARGHPPQGPLFVTHAGRRLEHNGVYLVVMQAAQRAGFHDPRGTLREKFTPHACRHWFTTHLRRAGMPRESIAWLRGDASSATIDIYLQIDPEAVREQYSRCIPLLGLS